jgi:hypothetical protein
MGHDPSPKAATHRSGIDLPTVKPKNYAQTAHSERAVPQYDPAAVAQAYLDDMEKGGRLHLKKKNRR